MSQKDKELLLKDLCARLPYGVKCKWENFYDGKTYTGGGVLCNIDHVKTPSGFKYWDCYFEDENDDIPIEIVKPYLRPMSSMTEEEKEEMVKLHIDDRLSEQIEICDANCIDFYNSHHLDYRGLIEKGLALEASEGMYNIN